MSDSLSMTVTNGSAVPQHLAPKLDPVAVLFALGSEVRLPIVRLLADGRAMTISQVAAAVRRDIDGVGKQLQVLSKAGIAEARPGKDRRQTVYQIPASRRPSPGVLDFGFCVLDLNKL